MQGTGLLSILLLSFFLPELRRTGPRSANYADKTANYACLRKIPGKNDNITQ